MTDEEFAAILEFGQETAGIEFKGPAPLTNRRVATQVVKAMLGMANARAGGAVIIGVEADRNTFNPVGITDDDLGTWVYDNLADRTAVYADPSIAFELEVKEYNGASYVVITVEEFSDIPVLCKKDYPDVLRAGACYVRTRRKPETTEIPTQTEMRDLLDLAINKGINRGLRQFLEQAKQAGLIEYRTARSPMDQEGFEEQIGDLR